MRGRWRGIALLTMVAVVVSGTLVGSALAQDTGGKAQKDKVIFTYGSTAEPSSMNPMAGYLLPDFYIWTMSYHLLINWAVKDFSAEPSLATSVDTSEDGMTFTYHLRDDITWSDGQPLTADDVAFSLNLYKSNHAYYPESYLTLIDGDVKVLDPTTIQFTTKQPTGLYSGKAPYMYDYILPKHIFENIEKPKQFENVPSVGSGPFYVAEYKVGEYVRMVRNPYWSGPAPYIDEIVYRIYKNDDALAQALKTGELDEVRVNSANIFNSLKDQPNITTMVGAVPEYDYFNMNGGSALEPKTATYTPHGDGNPALADPTVRLAIRMAIDSQELVDKVLLGYGSPGTSMVPPVVVKGARWDPTGTSDYIEWDIPGANKLLDDAGYKDCDGDGVRELPGCKQPSLDLRYFTRSSDQNTIDAAPFISKWLSEIGIKTEVQAVTSGQLGVIENAGEFDLAHWDWLPDLDPDPNLSSFVCDQRPPDGTAVGNNDAYWCNPEYDKLYLQQQAELDINKRWEIVHQMQKIFYEDNPYVVLWYLPVFNAWRNDRFTGYQPQPAPNGDPLEGYGGPSKVWWTLRPVGEGGTLTTKGVSSTVWLLVAGVVLVLGALLLKRRRRTEEDEV
ncbi:MAG: ABC transporter substrate-binding protein [Actinomycetota bacterium]|nr:ABC transporter substrate-binding protein [Actinomycetota bacterium]